MREELLAARGELAQPAPDFDRRCRRPTRTMRSLIEPGQMVVTITRDGFIKRTPFETFRAAEPRRSRPHRRRHARR